MLLITEVAIPRPLLMISLLILSVKLSDCDVEIKYLKLKDCAGKAGTSYILTTMDKVKRINCAVTCEETYQCVLFFYSRLTRTCSLHNRTLTDISMIAQEKSFCYMADDTLESWVMEVIRVSASDPGYPAAELIGPPDTVTWTPLEFNQDEFLEVKVSTELYIEHIRIYEYYGGGVSIVSLLTPDGHWYPVWKTDHLETAGNGLRILSLDIEVTHFKTSSVRMDIGARPLYTEEIDAIQVRGKLQRVFRKVLVP